MPRYPAKPLEEKLAWMRERQRAKEEEAREKEVDELMTRLMQLNREKAAKAREQMRLDGEPPSDGERPPQGRMLRVDEVAARLSVSVSTARRWFADRAIIVHPGPRRTTMLIPQQALDDWFAEHAPKRA